MKNMKQNYLKIKTMSKRKNFRFRICRVNTIIPSDYVKEIMSNISFNSRNTQSTLVSYIDNKSIDVIHNSDVNTSLIQKDICSSTSRVESLLEKVLYVSCISILINVIVLCIC